jgi:hypothetical protein
MDTNDKQTELLRKNNKIIKQLQYIKMDKETIKKHKKQLQYIKMINKLVNKIIARKCMNKWKEMLTYKTPSPKTKPKVITEDLGKIFEMAICIEYNIPYDGKYKYSLEDAMKIKDKFHNKLKSVFPHNIKHIAKNGSQYDFVSITDSTKYLSAKTTKKDGKVCPQVIGQPSKKKFCKHFNIDYDCDNAYIKYYIETNINTLLETYSTCTFDCPIVYYNKAKNRMLFVTLKENINWKNRDVVFSHNIKNKIWNESSSISIGGINIGEFQVHNHRDCIKFRWSFEKFIDLFKNNFEIVDFNI